MIELDFFGFNCNLKCTANILKQAGLCSIDVHVMCWCSPSLSHSHRTVLTVTAALFSSQVCSVTLLNSMNLEYLTIQLHHHRDPRFRDDSDEILSTTRICWTLYFVMHETIVSSLSRGALFGFHNANDLCKVTGFKNIVRKRLSDERY